MNQITKFDSKINQVDFNNRSVEKIDIKTFLEYPPVPMQRDTLARVNLKKTKKMLGKLHSAHIDVGVIELTSNCEYYGKEYHKGDRFIVNGNTRAYYWNNGLTDKIPSFVFASIYKLKDMEEVRGVYNTYDSPDATEKNQEKFYGILNGLYGYEAKSSKVLKGEILTSLQYASFCLDEVKYPLVGSKVDKMPFQVKEFFEEIKKFDEICKTPKHWDQALTCAALMLLKTEGENPKAIEFLQNIDQRSMDTTKAERDGASHVSYEWAASEKFKVKRAAFSKDGGLQETVPFILYWADKYIKDKKQIQCGAGWDKTASTWFNEYKSINNGLSQLLTIAN